ncbi:MAG TPA: VOC family protein [Candidatus Polarisedimenticolaceae bacterium]|nr:VOC family protein [Candidatus Polarisedimenticolaceae bacterium]
MPFQVRHSIPLIHVEDVGRSITFYEEFGFRVMNLHPGPGEGPVTWAWIESDAAQLMLAKASGPLVRDSQAVLLYLYCDDVSGAKAALEEAGIRTGEIRSPFYSPQGEFPVVDPDGYTLMVTHT